MRGLVVAVAMVVATVMSPAEAVARSEVRPLVASPSFQLAQPSSGANARPKGLRLSLRPTVRGEKVVASGSMSVGLTRAVVLQRKRGTRWINVAATRSKSDGDWNVRSSAPAKRGSYRARAPKTRAMGVTFPEVTSPAAKLRFVAQRVTLTAPGRVDEGRSFVLESAFSPIRVGREVQLQSRRDNGPWTVVGSADQTKTGLRTWRLQERHGQVSFRAVALASRGAPRASSPAANVDVVAPPPVVANDEIAAGRLEADYNVRLRTTDDRAGTWAVTEGTLPPGIVLDIVTGTLTGIPTQVGTYPVAISFTDAWNQVVTTPYSLRVYPRTIGSSELVSRPYQPGAPRSASSRPYAITASGSGVLFFSRMTNLVTPKPATSLFSYEAVTQSVSAKENTDTGDCVDGLYYAASHDGRFVLCMPRGSSSPQPLYLTDTETGVTETLSAPKMSSATVSDAGSRVAFTTRTNRIRNEGSEWDGDEAWVWDVETGATERISLAPDGAALNDAVDSVTISPDGRFVAFKTAATNVLDQEGPHTVQVYVRDVEGGATRLVSHSAAGSGPSEHQWDRTGGSDDQIAFSADGRHLAYSSPGSDIVDGVDTNDDDDVFIYDMDTGENVLVSRAVDGSAGSGFAVSVSGDGSVVAFSSNGSHLIPGDEPVAYTRAYLADLNSGTVDLVSAAPDGRPAGGYWAKVSEDGRSVTFASPDGDLDSDPLMAGSLEPYYVDVYLWRHD